MTLSGTSGSEGKDHRSDTHESARASLGLVRFVLLIENRFLNESAVGARVVGCELTVSILLSVMLVLVPLLLVVLPPPLRDRQLHPLLGCEESENQSESETKVGDSGVSDSSFTTPRTGRGLGCPNVQTQPTLEFVVAGRAATAALKEV